MAPVTVMLADDHQLVGDALCALLASDESCRVVGTVTSAAEAVEMVSRLHPDVLLMDVSMPGLSSFEAARKILAAQPQMKVIFLSGFMNDEYIEEALAVGASGYLLKSEPRDRILSAIHEAHAGQTCFSDEVRSRIVNDGGERHIATKGKVRASQLTAREREVLEYIAKGLSTKEIASLLHVSARTVDNHRTHLMNKLDIHDRVDLARFAIREGIAEA